MLVSDTYALVYLCTALPTTQCIAQQTSSCSHQKKRRVDLRISATWKKENITNAFLITKKVEKHEISLQTSFLYFVSFKFMTQQLSMYCPCPRHGLSRAHSGWSRAHTPKNTILGHKLMKYNSIFKMNRNFILKSNIWLQSGQMKSLWRNLKHTVSYGSFFGLHVASI